LDCGVLDGRMNDGSPVALVAGAVPDGVAELPVIGQTQTTLEGTLKQVDKGHRLRFFVRSPNASATFKTAILPDTSVVPAVILHMKLWTR